MMDYIRKAIDAGDTALQHITQGLATAVYTVLARETRFLTHRMTFRAGVGTTSDFGDIYYLVKDEGHLKALFAARGFNDADESELVEALNAYQLLAILRRIQAHQYEWEPLNPTEIQLMP